MRNLGSIEGQDVQNEEVFLTALLGKNYKENFEFLNYIEQEDSFYLLKNKDRDKKESIKHLFNTGEFEDNLNKVKEIRSSLAKFKKPLDDSISALSIDISSIESIFSEKEEVDYSKLFEDKDELWDMKEVPFRSLSYNDILGEHGIFTQLESLVASKDNFKSFLQNERINLILNQKDQFANLLKYTHFFGSHEHLVKQKQLNDSINLLFQNFDRIDTEQIFNGMIDLHEPISGLLDPNIIQRYSIQLDGIKQQIQSASIHSRVFLNLSSSREKLIEHLNKHFETENVNGICPLCGFNWESSTTLLENIEQQTKMMQELTQDGSERLNRAIARFKSDNIMPLKSLLIDYQKRDDFDEVYFKEYFEIKNIEELNKLKKSIDEIGVQLDDLLIKNTKSKVVIPTEELLQQIENKNTEYDRESIESYYSDYFQRYFGSSLEQLDLLSSELIQNKRKYIDWYFSLYQSNDLKEKKAELKLKQDKSEIFANKIEELEKLQGIYAESLKKYNSILIKDIEILFHVYSGRIVQYFQGGLGLFIINKNDGIKFVTSPEKSYDAIFSMSTGQLSALIISFTLALNKKYSKNKILFIDDPVQTMDEINMAGFIELLRNDFPDRQIFISTHEEMMSTYMRYKFEKYDLTTHRIDVKSLKN